MDFIKSLQKCQYEKHMTNDAFAHYVGKSRAWLQRIYSKNPDVEKSTLTGLTMYTLNEKLGIPIEIMEAYNESVLNAREGNE